MHLYTNTCVAQIHVEFFGFTFSNDGMKHDLEKVNKIKSTPASINVKKTLKFFGSNELLQTFYPSIESLGKIP